MSVLMVIHSLQFDGTGDVGDAKADGEALRQNVGEAIFDDACK